MLFAVFLMLVSLSSAPPVISTSSSEISLVPLNVSFSVAPGSSAVADTAFLLIPMTESVSVIVILLFSVSIASPVISVSSPVSVFIVYCAFTIPSSIFTKISVVTVKPSGAATSWS